ncbi:MAG TPA: hypothetical protein VEM59_08475 [Acidimicrobiia bacterium]|nr:hypothetical protein [Acidimicrobiia bacterium]
MAIIQRVYGAMKNRDASVMQELFADDVVVRQSADVPWAVSTKGRTALSPSS